MTYRLKQNGSAKADETKFYRVKMPINSDLKKWSQKWWGREAFFADRQTTLGTLLLSNLDFGLPPFEPESKTVEGMDDYLFIYIPLGSYLIQRRIIFINETLRHWLIDQIVAVSCAKRDALESPATAVVEYYAAEFNLQYTHDALEKASQRLREQRHLPRFVTRKG